MYAPVVTRFRTYGVKLGATGAAYMEAVLADPDFRAWEDQAKKRPAAGAADGLERRWLRAARPVGMASVAVTDRVHQRSSLTSDRR